MVLYPEYSEGFYQGWEGFIGSCLWRSLHIASAFWPSSNSIKYLSGDQHFKPLQTPVRLSIFAAHPLEAMIRVVRDVLLARLPVTGQVLVVFQTSCLLSLAQLPDDMHLVKLM